MSRHAAARYLGMQIMASGGCRWEGNAVAAGSGKMLHVNDAVEQQNLRVEFAQRFLSYKRRTVAR